MWKKDRENRGKNGSYKRKIKDEVESKNYPYLTPTIMNKTSQGIS